MAKIGDTKGGAPQTGGTLGRVLPMRAKLVDPKIDVKSDPSVHVDEPAPEHGAHEAGADQGAVFDKTASRDLSVPDVHAAGGPGGGVRARLLALGVKRAEDLPIKQADGVRTKDTPIGKILDGSVTIEGAKGFTKLEGVVQVTGDVTVQEARLAGGEVTPVSTLVEIGGRLTTEGVTS